MECHEKTEKKNRYHLLTGAIVRLLGYDARCVLCQDVGELLGITYNNWAMLGYAE